MVSQIISRIVILIFGILYPAYSSYKAVRTKNVREYVKWMMYWIVFALFTFVETFADIFVSWFPFYYEVKIIFVLWLLSPMTKGSSFLYRKFVHPLLLKRENEIDEYLEQARTRGYKTLVTLSKNGLTIAATTLMQTAVRGQSHLSRQLRSLSLTQLDTVGLQSEPKQKDQLDGSEQFYEDDDDEEMLPRRRALSEERPAPPSRQRKIGSSVVSRLPPLTEESSRNPPKTTYRPLPTSFDTNDGISESENEPNPFFEIMDPSPVSYVTEQAVRSPRTSPSYVRLYTDPVDNRIVEEEEERMREDDWEQRNRVDTVMTQSQNDLRRTNSLRSNQPKRYTQDCYQEVHTKSSQRVATRRSRRETPQPTDQS